MSVDELKQQGNAAVKIGDYATAIQCYSKAIDIEPENHILYSNRSNIYYQAKNFEKALEDGKQCVQIKPAFGKGYVRIADSLNAMGKSDEALQALTDGATNDPNEPLIAQRREAFIGDMQNQMQYQLLGRTEDELRMKIAGNPKVSQMVIQDPTLFVRLNTARQSPNFMMAAQSDKVLMNVILEMMGMGAMMQQQEQKSCPNNNQCGDSCCQNTGGSCCSEKQAQPKVETPKVEAKPMKSTEEIKADEFKNQGNVYFKEAKYEEAITCYEKAFEEFKNITFLNNIATALLKQGKFQESLAKAEEAYQFGRENSGSSSFQEMAKSLSKQGSALYKLNRYEDAIRVLKDSMIEFRDKTTLALLNKVEDEFSAFKKKSIYSPEEAVNMKNAGNELFKANKFIEAAEKFTEGIAHLPYDLMDADSKVIFIQLHNNRSLALFKAGQIHPSYADCEKVLKEDPNHLKALLRKAQIERLRKQYYLSVETYQQVIQLDSQNAEAMDGFQKTSMKIHEMQSGQLSEQEMQEIANIAMADPDMQNLAQDPGMSQMIQVIQQNPQQAQHFLSDPAVSKKLQRLINAGVLRTGPPPRK
ncbi:Stress-induced protein sti1 [Spironucleus salmonicida]|uniref:Stress-induced protein sti1 n=1 Tax=Spironucleus salmonicida TaxID=348837 RepID=V6LGQ7_9EUKA|nr:Stress-induced protein sti1 [Spironucleus salmonicida]|eukprot:EST43725.1 Stress-induced protein sti1 [Spironucleus salmonicida]